MTGRVKYCEVCKIDFSILFRVQYQTSKEWIFVCHECLLNLKKDNPALDDDKILSISTKTISVLASILLDIDKNKIKIIKSKFFIKKLFLS